MAVKSLNAFDSGDLGARGADNRKMIPYWDKADAIMDGEDAVRDAGETFIPKFTHETDEAFRLRLDCGKFTNIFYDIVDDLHSKPFEEEITFVEDDNKAVPEIVKNFAEDVDGQGANLTVFAKDAFFHAIASAIHWISVDYPERDEAVRTLADAKAAGLRPTFSHILGRNMLEVRSKKINGKETLTYARILEPGETMAENRVRLYERDDSGAVTWGVYKQVDKDKWIEEKGGVLLNMDVIPLVPIITGRREGTSWRIAPPLKSALSLQVTLYRQESALEFAKVMAAYPMLSGNGVSPQKDAENNPVRLAVGPGAVLYAPRDGNGNAGSWGYVEPSGSSLTFMSSDIDKTKTDLRELGKQPLTAQSANLTVITTAVAAGKAKSAVNAWGLALKNALENAMVIACRWLNVPDAQYSPDLNIYDDYNDFSDVAAGLDALQAARTSGDISRETYLNELKRRRVLSPEVDIEKEAEKLLSEVPGDDDRDEDNETLNPSPKVG